MTNSCFCYIRGNITGDMNSLFYYCCQGLLNIFPQNNKGKRVVEYKSCSSFVVYPAVYLFSILLFLQKRFCFEYK